MSASLLVRANSSIVKGGRAYVGSDDYHRHGERETIDAHKCVTSAGQN